MPDEDRGETITAAQRTTFVAVLDEIIPPSKDGRLPGAGAAGVLDSVIAGLKLQPPALKAVLAGLAALDDRAREAGAADFAALSREDRVDGMRALERDQPEFIPSLIYLTYTGYYQIESVTAGLGLESWPPHPGGFHLAASDPALVDPVRRRGKIYRE
jgi:hypothetical protein